MKKHTFILAIMFLGGSMMAQDLTSKKGEMFLPEAGDYAIGIDATPFLEYFGNFIGGDGNNSAPTFQAHSVLQGSGPSGYAIYGKTFIDANTAYRGMARIGFNSSSDREFVTDVTDPGETVEDEIKMSDFGVTLGAGIEKRRGNTRLQGLYGAQAMIGFGSSKTEWTYGNDISDVGGSRVTEVKNGSTVSFGVTGFAGVEYFFAPKMSVGGEYNWGLGISSEGDGEATVEIDGASDEVTETGGGSSFGIDTGTIGHFALKMLFHF